ncbi:glycosyltransferase family 4 protein [Polynucleobacter paneuropaeus]|nr:glycosyltransferase family 4 protein [Polynucleobacter paneuropaeus]
MSKEKILVVAAVPETILAFMSNHLQALSNVYDVSVVCGGLNAVPKSALIENVSYIDISIEREISPFKDLISLFRLIKFLKSNNFLLVQSITPKAGFLTMMAAWLCGIPIRVHIFTGQVWATKKGFFRLYLKQFDKLIAFFSTFLLVDSPSQRDFLLSQGISSASKINVLGNGSICGVDIRRFRSSESARSHIRSQMNIPANAVLALYMGRLKRDKGLLDLAYAFESLDLNLLNLYLVLVGSDEEGLVEEIRNIILTKSSQIFFVGAVSNPEDYIAAADFLCLPSYREGFGLVIIEAAAAGIPTLASRIYGITDAVIDGVTGILHEPGDCVGIAGGLNDLYLNSSLRQRLGYAAKDRALRLFSTSYVIDAQMAYFEKLIKGYRQHG